MFGVEEHSCGKTHRGVYIILLMVHLQAGVDIEPFRVDYDGGGV